MFEVTYRYHKPSDESWCGPLEVKHLVCNSLYELLRTVEAMASGPCKLEDIFIVPVGTHDV